MEETDGGGELRVERSVQGDLSRLSRVLQPTGWAKNGATPPHLMYAATLPCNLSPRACFADINVSQGTVATYARCGEIFNTHLTANLLRTLPLNFF